MALATLQYNGPAARGGHRFSFDIGKNRYYQFAIGSEEKDYSGIALLKFRAYESALMGPVEETSFGRGIFEVPGRLFEPKDALNIQLISYRDERKNGPAISEIIPVETGAVFSDEELPEYSFSNAFSMTHQARQFVPENVAFRSPPKRAYSETLFWESLISAALPIINNLLSGIRLPGNTGSGTAAPAPGAAAGAGGSPLNTIINLLNNDQIRNALTGLISSISGGGATPAAAASPATPAAAPAPAAPAAPGTSRQTSISPYSEAKIAPALLAALPALIPLLQQIVNVGPQMQQQMLDHLRATLPELGPAPGLLLATLSLSVQKNQGLPEFKPSRTLKLRFDGATPMMIMGKERLLFGRDADARLPLTLAGEKMPQKATLFFQVKNAQTLDQVVTKKYKIDLLQAGTLPVVPVLFVDELKNLLPTQDYLVCAHLIWQNKSGQRFGASTSMITNFMEQYIFSHLDVSSLEIPLNDVDQHRAFWHKVWEADFTQHQRKFIVDTAYYCGVDRQQKNSARMETLVKSEVEKTDTSIRIKSGMLYSLEQLNELLPKLGNYPYLNAPQLQALQTNAFTDLFQTAATTSLQLFGHPREKAALWVYPELKLQGVIFLSIARKNQNGMVEETVQQKMYFPIPSSVHFIGVKNQL